MTEPVTECHILVAALADDEEGHRLAVEVLLGLEAREGHGDLVLADSALGEHHHPLVLVELGRGRRPAATVLVAVVEGIDRPAFEERRIVAVARKALCGTVLAVDVGLAVGLEACDGGRGAAILGGDGQADVRSGRERSPLGIGVPADGQTTGRGRGLREHEARQCDEGDERPESRKQTFHNDPSFEVVG